MSLHVIVGAGAVGAGVAEILADRGDQVRIVSRSGGGPQRENVSRVRTDATDTDRLRATAEGADALYNCANPPYHRWHTDWPPLASALLSAAEASGAVLVTMSNLYGYGEVAPAEQPLTEETPLRATTVKGRVRADMWRRALAVHQAGRVRVTEARASDFVGVGAGSMVTERVVPPVVAGKRAVVPADLDAPHTWTHVRDAARTLVTLAGDERAWGRPWHVPSPPDASIRQLATRLAELAGAPPPRLARMPAAMLRLAALSSPRIRAFLEVRYQFAQPFVMDATAATTTFGIEPTGLDDTLREMAAAARKVGATD